MASFGMEVDHRIISVVQLDRSHLEPIVAPVGHARVSIGAISSEQRGMRNHATVTLRRGDDETVGLAEGSIAESSRNRAVAQATLEALRQLVPTAESADVETAGCVHLGTRDVAVATLVFVVPPHEEIVSGSAVVRGGRTLRGRTAPMTSAADFSASAATVMVKVSSAPRQFIRHPLSDDKVTR